MTKRLLFIAVLAVCCLRPPAAHAWDEVGHRVIAYIAWQHMTPAARAEAIRLLHRAPWRADLSQLFPTTGGPLPVREATFFTLASIWPDVVRDAQRPERRERYHHGSWHYINYFWDQEGPGGAPRDRTDLQPAPQNAVERLAVMEEVLSTPLFASAQRAVALAWVLHLVGDLHQPLHTSARVTEAEPRGDQGGNLFRLDGDDRLHGYWDGIIRRTWSRRPGEADAAYVARVAGAVMAEHPQAGVEGALEPGAYERWAREGYATTKAHLYPPDLERGAAPPVHYRDAAYEIAEAAAARAGYRLAELLNRLLG